MPFTLYVYITNTYSSIIFENVNILSKKKKCLTYIKLIINHAIRLHWV